jgi:DNA uptake protein ComE-like DNA-binding protein
MEKMGLIGLTGFMIILILIRATLHLWVHPKTDPVAEQKIEKAWQDFRAHQEEKDSLEEVNANKPIDLNTADSIALINIDHIGPVLARRIIEKRKAIGHYSSFDQLLDIPRFPSNYFDEIKAHLIIR